MTFPFYREGYFGIRKKIRLYQKADATIGESSETSRFRRALEGEPLKADQVCAAPSTDKISPVT